jgi:minor extracellular protease Epr
MKRYLITSAVIVILCLPFSGGMALAEPLDSQLSAQSDNLKSEPAVPKPLQPKKVTPFIKKGDTEKKIYSPKKIEIGNTPKDNGEGGAEPEELPEVDYYEEKPPSIRRFQGGGRSLLGRGLPPPPSVLPPVTKKDPDIIEPGEVVIISADMEGAQTIAQQSDDMGFSIKRRRILPGLGLVISILRVPEGKTVSDTIKTLRENLPKLWTDANHRYQLQSGEQDGVKRYGHKLIGWEPTSNNCGAGLFIGLVDTMVDTNHPALKGRRFVARSFLTHGVKPAPMKHGTAVAALLIGSPRQASLAGLLPGAELYAAGIFRQHQKHRADTTAELVVLALDWLIDQKAVIINLSLGGPRNLIIEAAVQRVQALGVTLTAAAGNTGKNAPPVYPAAHEGVIAVTAIDARLKPYKLANRGDYISFAAPGVDIWTAKPGGGGTYASGTSFAVPFVTATVGAAMIKRHGVPWPDLLKQMKKEARDLGKSGRDPVFGWGLVQALGPCADIMRLQNSSTLNLRKSVKPADIKFEPFCEKGRLIDK